MKGHFKIIAFIIDLNNKVLLLKLILFNEIRVV